MTTHIETIARALNSGELRAAFTVNMLRMAPQISHANIEVLWNLARSATLEEAAMKARMACLVPPDGGEPTEAERAVSDRAEAAIRALVPNVPKEG